MRWQLINELLGGKGNYLEIGVYEGSCGQQIRATTRWGVDPKPLGRAKSYFHHFFIGTSDNFFRQLAADVRFNVIFIDGLHHAEQVYRDVLNSLRHLADGGTIVLHDCNPATREAQIVPRRQNVWNGDTWKALVQLRARHPELRTFVVDADEGLGVVQRVEAPQESVTVPRDPFQMTWEDLVRDRRRLLGLVPVSAWRAELVRPTDFRRQWAESSRGRWEELGLVPKRAPVTAVDRIAVVTVATGKFRARPLRSGLRGFLFTDGPAVPGWALRPIPRSTAARRASRRPKILTLDLLDDCDVVLYLDATHELTGDPTTWVQSALRDCDVATFKHPSRDCVYQEAAECARLKLDDPKVIAAQIARYHAEGHPPHGGLRACNVIVRRRTPGAISLGREWWTEVERGSYRDQISFPVVMRRLGVRVGIIPGHCYKHPLVRYVGDLLWTT